MQARMTHPVFVVPAALKALTAYSRAAEGLGVPAETIEMIHLRASQINGCSVCVELHSTNLKKEGMSDERLFAVAAWRDAPYFTDAERAALELTEARDPRRRPRRPGLRRGLGRGGPPLRRAGSLRPADRDHARSTSGTG